MIWFCSDNGPELRTPGRTEAELGGRGEPRSRVGLRGRKRSLYEGGVRVPGLLVWPDRIKTPRVSRMPCVTSDFYPTILELVGLKLDQDDQRVVDGSSLVEMIDGQQLERMRPIGFRSRDQVAFVTQRFKIYRKGNRPWELYDLIDDPGETSDLSEDNPDQLDSIVEQFEMWQASVESESR